MQQRTFVVSRSAALICAAALLALLPTVSQALGIGDLKLQSALSEPFRAEIELTGLSPKDLKTLKANLVRPADVAGQTLSPGTPVTRQLAVRIADQPDGRHVLRLYSDESIREPYVHFLLQLDWAGGRLTREFTALLDPRQGAAEDDAPMATAQVPTSDSTPTAALPEASAAVGTAPAPAPSVVAAAKPDTASRPDDTKPTVTTTVQAPAEAQKSTQATPVPNNNQRERLVSEIKTWAQTHAHPQAKADTSEPGATEAAAPPQQSPSARTTAAEMRRKIAEHERANLRAAEERQPTPRGWIGEHSDELLMGAVALVALLLVGFGTVWLTLTWRPRPTPSINPQPPGEAPTEVLDQRQRGGRRRQFIPVAIERRRGPRRQSDIAQPALAPIDTSDAISDSYQDDSVERALKEEISKHPARIGLKLKLLALYHARDDRDSFETLLNNMYASAESEPPSDEGDWPRFEDYDDLAASDGAAPVLTDRSPAQSEDNEAKTEKHPSTDDDAPAPRTLPEPDVPEYPLLVDEQNWTDIDDGLLDLQSSLIEYEPAGVEDFTVGPRETADIEDFGHDELHLEAADSGDFEHEAVHVDDLSNVRKIVEQGMDASAGKNGDEQSPPASRPRLSKKGGKRGRAASKQNSVVSPDARGKAGQWHDPARKIDLAKAYIDMGDAERARHILDEVLQHWHRSGGTKGQK
jgi:FimV-like protein